MTAHGPEDETGAQAAGRPASTSEPAPAAAPGQPGDAIPSDPQALAEDIERTREQLGDTVETLAAKLDVKAQARGKTAEMRNRVAAVSGQAAERVTATTGSVKQQMASKTGRLTKAATVGGAKIQQLTPEPARQVTARAARTARERPVPYAAAAAGAAALLLTGWLVWRRGRR
jgi:Protein of unknown function (DUF3618)